MRHEKSKIDYIQTVFGRHELHDDDCMSITMNDRNDVFVVDKANNVAVKITINRNGIIVTAPYSKITVHACSNGTPALMVTK